MLMRGEFTQGTGIRDALATELANIFREALDRSGSSARTGGPAHRVTKAVQSDHGSYDSCEPPHDQGLTVIA